MTNETKDTISSLLAQGYGYRKISIETGISINSIKSWCRRHPIQTHSQSACKYCGSPLHQTPGKRQRRFCSDQCRLQWWKEHPEARIHRAEYRHVCRFCGKEFSNDRVTASYCGRLCFAKARMRVTLNG